MDTQWVDIVFEGAYFYLFSQYIYETFLLRENEKNKIFFLIKMQEL